MKSKILLIALLMLSLAFARQEIPYVYEEEDFGNEELPRFLYSLSVDCETANPEAYGFWTRWFQPVAWALERRV